MKKVFLIAVLFTCLSNLASAQTDSTQKDEYYYYPQQNVYYNQKNNNYTYYDSVGSTWKNVKQLPAYYNVSPQTPKDVIYYNGSDVWMDNAKHIKQYGKTSSPKGAVK